MFTSTGLAGVGYRYQRYRRVVMALATVYAFVFGLFVVMHRTIILPAKFSYDGDVIGQLAAGRIVIREDSSYTNTARVYDFLGLGSHATSASVVGLAAATAVVLLCLVRTKGFHGGLPEAALAGLIIVLAAVYIGYYSKELTVLPFTALVLLVPSGIAFDAVLVAAMLVYSQVFRQYWAIIAVVYVALRIVNWRRIRVIPSVATGVASLVALALAFAVILGLPVDHYREMVNSARGAGPDSMTAIGSFTDIADPVGGIVNAIASFGFLFVPIPMVLLGGAYYAGLALLIAGIWAYFFVSLCRVGRVLPGASHEINVLVRRSTAFVLAFVTVQSIFEPDFGSALRHQVPILPLVLLVCLVARGSPGPADRSHTPHQESTMEQKT